MKVAVLTSSPRGRTFARLSEAGARRGHECFGLRTQDAVLVSDTGQPGLLHLGKRVDPFDAVIPRIGTSLTFFGAAVVRQFEQMGVFTLNSAAAILAARDKLATLQILSRHQIGITRSVAVHHADNIPAALEQIGGAPAVIKLVHGTHGIGVMLAESEAMAHSILKVMQALAQPVLVQRFVAESRGTDVRAFVVGDRVVAAARRMASRDFRSNVHLGGRAEPIDLDPAYEDTAVRAARLLGLGIAGVDMLVSSDGPLVMEVNASPGIRGIEECTHVDIATEIFEHIEAKLALEIGVDTIQATL